MFSTGVGGCDKDNYFSSCFWPTDVSDLQSKENQEKGFEKQGTRLDFPAGKFLIRQFSKV
jgi:hypothetical protein